MTATLTRLLVLSTLVSLVVPACTTFNYDDTDYVGESSYQLGELTQPDGSTEIYELQVRPNGTAYITIQREEPVDYQELGLHLVELDKERAEKCKPKARPYSGLFVRAVDPDSPAARAGVKKGDLLLSVNGSDVYYLKEYNKIAAEIKEKKRVSLRVRGWDDLLQVEPKTRSRIARMRTNVPLEAPARSNPKPYAGVRLRVIPEEHARKIYGDDRNAVVVCGVVLGSPAYLAGLRAGDIIQRVDDKPTPTLTELLRLLRERGPLGGLVTFDLVRESGKTFTADVHLEDYSGTTGARIPGVFEVSSRAGSSRWEVLPWGVFADYYNSYKTSKSRNPEEYGHYKMFLGLFKYSWGPRGPSTRLFWIIEFQ
jgi:serine protease Do